MSAPNSATIILGEIVIVLRLDYLSCVLTVISTILVGRRIWEGWVLAAVNSVIICVIGAQTSQTGFISANLFCIVLYGINLRSWRKDDASS
jgi:nicotinamide riboside transporter PnuC